jgi:hypothetical protein
VNTNPQLQLHNINGSAKDDHTKQLICSINPVQNIMPFVQGKKLAVDIEERNESLSRSYVYKRDGISEVLTTDAELAQIAKTLAMQNYCLEDNFISDLHCGLYTMLTQNPAGFIDYKPTYWPNGSLKSVVIYTTLKTVYKAAFGPLVKTNGIAISGASKIIEEAKKNLMLILTGKKPMPRARVSCQTRDKETGKYKRALIEGEPLHIFRFTENYNNIIAIELDGDYAPLKVKNNKIIAKDGFIHSVAGLTVFLQYGKKITPSAQNHGLQAKNAKKIITAIQTAYEIGQILGIKIEKTANGRLNLALQSSFIQDVVPEAMWSNGRIDYKKASNMIAMAGQYYRNAITETGILQQISEPKSKVFIPATDKAAEFPEEFPNTVYLKVERLRGKSIPIGQAPG